MKFSFDTGCRRAESRQLLKEILNYSPIVKSKSITLNDGNQDERQIIYYQTHKIRCKGSGKTGKVRRFRISVDTFDSIKKWIEVRGDDDCPYVFVAKRNSVMNQISESSLNVWCSGLFSEIVGRRIHPHIWRESRATSIVVEDGMDITKAQRLLGHNDVSTTNIYVIRDDDEDEIDDLF